MGILTKGNKCVLYHNVDRDDAMCPLRHNEEPPLQIPKTYEVYHLVSDEWHYFPMRTPHYKRRGWDNLEDAKAFFLLMEI